MSVYVSGDEIHFAGYLVAMIAQAETPPSVIAEFVDGLDNGTLFEGEVKSEALGEFLRRARKLSRGGLLKLHDLEQLYAIMEGEHSETLTR